MYFPPRSAQHVSNTIGSIRCFNTTSIRHLLGPLLPPHQITVAQSSSTSSPVDAVSSSEHMQPGRRLQRLYIGDIRRSVNQHAPHRQCSACLLACPVKLLHLSPIVSESPCPSTNSAKHRKLQYTQSRSFHIYTCFEFGLPGRCTPAHAYRSNGHTGATNEHSLPSSLPHSTSPAPMKRKRHPQTTHQRRSVANRHEALLQKGDSFPNC
jgi:hypothetical protein